MAIAIMAELRPARPRERMNSPLEEREVRRRGLGGPAVCGAPRTGASATGPCAPRAGVSFRGSAAPRSPERQSLGATEESTCGPLVAGRNTHTPAATVRAGGLRVFPAA